MLRCYMDGDSRDTGLQLGHLANNLRHLSIFPCSVDGECTFRTFLYCNAGMDRSATACSGLVAICTPSQDSKVSPPLGVQAIFALSQIQGTWISGRCPRSKLVSELEGINILRRSFKEKSLIPVCFDDLGGELTGQSQRPRPVPRPLNFWFDKRCVQITEEKSVMNSENDGDEDDAMEEEVDLMDLALKSKAEREMGMQAATNSDRRPPVDPNTDLLWDQVSWMSVGTYS